jgi:hypothetical protein
LDRVITADETVLSVSQDQMQVHVVEIEEPILNSGRSGGNIVKSWREITLKNSRLLISAAHIFRKLILKLIFLTLV